MAQISRVLTQVCSGMEFGDDNPCFLPVNDFVNNAIGQTSTWLIEGKHTYFTTFLGSLAVRLFSLHSCQCSGGRDAVSRSRVPGCDRPT